MMSARLMTEVIALTPAGRAGLEQEFLLLCGERLPALTARLREAREDTAMRDEDAGLHELLEEHHRLERCALEIERLLAVAAEVVPPGDGLAGLGSRVEVDDDDGERDVFQLVDPCEANAIEGRISLVSPVGRALLGHIVGDEVIVPLPVGERRLRVVGLA